MIPSHTEPEGQLAHSSKIKRGERDGIIQVILVVLVLAGGIASNRFLASQSSSPALRASATDELLVEVVQPTIQDTQIRLNETGTVQVRNSIDLSPQVSGRVVYVNPNLASGGSFRSGEVLFRLDDADYRAAMDRALADLSAARADLQVERSESEIAKREWNLVNPGEPVPANVAREPQIARASATVQSREAALADARLDLQRIDFSLPFSGRILSTTIEVGQNLSANQSYGRAYDPDEVEVSVPINAGALEALSPMVGRTANVRPSNQGIVRRSETYPATVTRVDAELDAQTRLARVTLAFEDQVALLPGNFVDVELLGPVLEGAYFIPERALTEQRMVWVVEDGRLSARQPGFVSAKDGMFITLPFDTADGIVVTALTSPEEGDRVRMQTLAGADGADQ
jgi:RND family efflux transporter MFP subunit